MNVTDQSSEYKDLFSLSQCHFVLTDSGESRGGSKFSKCACHA